VGVGRADHVVVAEEPTVVGLDLAVGPGHRTQHQSVTLPDRALLEVHRLAVEIRLGDQPPNGRRARRQLFDPVVGPRLGGDAVDDGQRLRGRLARDEPLRAASVLRERPAVGPAVGRVGDELGYRVAVVAVARSRDHVRRVAFEGSPVAVERRRLRGSVEGVVGAAGQPGKQPGGSLEGAPSRQ
jgi:hypothetical protein